MPFALITGASGGIGLAIAEELAKKKYDLLLVARLKDKLEVAGSDLSNRYAITVNTLSIDLSEPNAVHDLLNWVDSNRWEVSVLVNNAGYGIWGKFGDIPVSDSLNMMDLNMKTPVNLCYGMLARMHRNNSYILNVASTAAYQAVPTLAIYSATKIFLLNFSRGLYWELKDKGIHVSCLSPGPTSTSFIERAGMTLIQERAEKFSMSAQSVALIAVKGMFNHKVEIVPGFMNWLSVKFIPILPKTWVEKIAMGLYKV